MANDVSSSVDAYIEKTAKWRDVLKRLRKIAQGCSLTEELKWGKPCYTVQGGNVVILVGFKEYCSVLFCKGALLKDPKGVLITPTENTQAARQMRFTSAREVDAAASTLKAYIEEAIEAEKAGLEVKYKKTAEYKVPAELKSRLDKSPALKTAFGALTPGRQRGYILYFSSAKQSKTREARVEKCLPRILQGKGLDD